MSLQKKEKKDYSLLCQIKNKEIINNIIILKDGRLSSCTEEGSLIIYNKINYSIEDLIKEKEPIFYHIELSNTNIITCGETDSINIYKLNKDKKYELFQNFKAYDEIRIYKILEFDDDTLITSNSDLVKIWKNKENNNYIQIRALRVDNGSDPVNILKINNSKLVCSGSYNGHIVFYQIKDTIKAVGYIENINCRSSVNSMCLVNGNILLVGGNENNGIYLIDINKYVLIANILKKTKLYLINSVIRMKNENILIGFEDDYGKYFIVEYKYDNNNNNLLKIRSIDNAHKEEISGLIEMDKGIIISYSHNKIISFWKKK